MAEPQEREETVMETNKEALMRILTECPPERKVREAMRHVACLQERLSDGLTPGQRRLFEEEQEAVVTLAATEEEEMCVKAFLLGARTAFQSVGAEAIGESEDDRLMQALASLTR